jgi:hypothetical protein
MRRVTRKTKEVHKFFKNRIWLLRCCAALMLPVLPLVFLWAERNYLARDYQDVWEALFAIYEKEE